MDEQMARKILRQIASGNSVFDLNTTEQAGFLGYTPEVEVTDADASNLRYHLELLAQQGAIRLGEESLGGGVTADLTARGRELLRRLGG